MNSTNFSLPSNPTIKASKAARYLFLGAVFWFAAAMLIRFIGPYTLTEGNPLRVVMFVITIPVTIGFLATAKVVSQVGWSHLLRPVVMMTYTATFLDGIAMTWFQGLYGNSGETALLGAALILWGVGVALCMAHLLEHATGDEAQTCCWAPVVSRYSPGILAGRRPGVEPP